MLCAVPVRAPLLSLARAVQASRAGPGAVSLRLPPSAAFLSTASSAPPGPQAFDYDVGVIGGGIVGLATAMELAARFPAKSIAVFEKEHGLAMHQTGNNSGVIHAGIYYKTGSLKAKLCVEGLNLTYAYCDRHGIPYQKCGKLIVARNQKEVPGLISLYERGIANGVKGLRLIGADDMRAIEPNCLGVMAIHSPNTGIVDWRVVTESYAKTLLENPANRVLTGHEVVGLRGAYSNDPLDFTHGVTLDFKSKKSITCRSTITCAGVYSDRLAIRSGGSKEPVMVPIRGEYLVLKPSLNYLVRGLIYPVPDPTLPFLGVHFTPTMRGQVLLGPNAVLAFSREGYSFFDVNWKDLFETLRFRGLHKLMLKYWKFGIGEMYRSRVLPAQVKLLQDYVPSITANDVERGPAGIRAQAMDFEGNLVDDFVFETGHGHKDEQAAPSGSAASEAQAKARETTTPSPPSEQIKARSAAARNLLHVRNAPSPGATSSLAIAKVVADKAEEMFRLRDR